jgi:thiol:disulfide interchange protein
MQDAQPPEQVQASFSDAVKAREDKQRLINEAQTYANDILPSIASIAVSHPLPIDEAFDIHFINNVVQIVIADQYKLYEDRLNISVENADLDKVKIPKGKEYKDELLEETRFVFVGTLNIPLTISKKSDGAVVIVNYQGCWDGGVCYPPSVKKFYLK